MPQVELDYFSLAYNKLNETTIVTDVKNLNAAGIIIKVGRADDTCRLNVRSDLMTVINKVKPNLVVIKNPDPTIEDFCKLIGVKCERFEDRDINKYLLDEFVTENEEEEEIILEEENPQDEQDEQDEQFGV